MKRILYLLLPILSLTLSLNSCAALKKEQTQKKKRNAIELPPNTASNKYSKKRNYN